ncbi:DUF3369 domain-containing protein [Candidatus Auribacterota bacterium]
MKTNWNKTILCIDDEEPILQAYKEMLTPESSEISGLKDELENLFEEDSEDKKNKTSPVIPSYQLLFASSGEEAVKIAQQEKKAGRNIAAAFFDMRLKTKMDGLETIKAIKNIFPSILCAVVTAYTDYTIERIGALFRNQDEWIYFNKPFTKGELLQIACNLVSSWNIRHENKKYMRDLSRLIIHISGIKEIGLNDLKTLLKGVLAQVIDFVGSKSGFLATIDKKNNSLNFEVGIGNFEDEEILNDNNIQKLNDQIIQSSKKGTISQFNEFVVLPIKAFQFESVIIYIDIENETDNKDNHQLHLLKVLVQNVSAAIDNAKHYENSVETEKGKKNLAIKTLQKIITTLYHYLNNPLTMIKGLAVIRGELDSKTIKEKFHSIQKLSDEIVSVIEILGKLNHEDIKKKIEFNIDGLEVIDIEHQLEKRKNELEKKYQKGKKDSH